MNKEYITLKEPTLNCKDMDARLRGILLAQLGKPTMYSFTYKARVAFAARAAEITDGTIELLLRSIPDSFTIMSHIWQAFSDTVLDRIITADYWESEACEGCGSVPDLVEDFILIHGEKLLEKYEKSDMVVSQILCRSKGARISTIENKIMSPMACPETLLKYYKRFRRMNKKWKSEESNLVDNIGRYIMDAKLEIVPHETTSKSTEVTQ